MKMKNVVRFCKNCLELVASGSPCKVLRPITEDDKLILENQHISL